MQSSDRKMLKKMATDVTKNVMGRLPRELQSKLPFVAIVFQYRPDKNQLADGVESDCLGLFTGNSIREGDENASLPPQIFLFLENIYAESLESGRGYREELRRTFLHELGHYLGLEEDDLAIRDVD